MPPECLTFAQYGALFPATRANSVQDHAAFVAACDRFGINTPGRMAAFCAEIAHEGSGRTRLTENLHYTVGGLIRTWPKKFIRAQAEDYVRRGPEAIANRAYAGVNGNGDEASGDGWRYRGRSDIQLTGRANYQAAEAGTGIPLVDSPELATDPSNSAIIAAWFWASKGLNALADKGDIIGITKAINGGLNGLSERVAFWKTFKGILGVQEGIAA